MARKKSDDSVVVDTAIDEESEAPLSGSELILPDQNLPSKLLLLSLIHI